MCAPGSDSSEDLSHTRSSAADSTASDTFFPRASNTFSGPVCSRTRRMISSVAPVRLRSETIASYDDIESTVSLATRSPKRSRTKICSTVAASRSLRGNGLLPWSPAASTAALALSRTTSQSSAKDLMSISRTSLDTPAASVRMMSAQSLGTTVAPTALT